MPLLRACVQLCAVASRREGFQLTAAGRGGPGKLRGACKSGDVLCKCIAPLTCSAMGSAVLYSRRGSWLKHVLFSSVALLQTAANSCTLAMCSLSPAILVATKSTPHDTPALLTLLRFATRTHTTPCAHQIAQLLSQLPAEMDVETLVASALRSGEGGSFSACDDDVCLTHDDWAEWGAACRRCGDAVDVLAVNVRGVVFGCMACESGACSCKYGEP